MDTKKELTEWIQSVLYGEGSDYENQPALDKKAIKLSKIYNQKPRKEANYSNPPAGLQNASDKVLSFRNKLDKKSEEAMQSGTNDYLLSPIKPYGW